MNLPKLWTPRSFSKSTPWWILVGWLLSSSFTLTWLFQNHVEWILPAFLNSLHLWDNWWFLLQMHSKTKSLLAKLSRVKTSYLLWKFCLLMRMLHFYFLHLNLTIAVSFFFKGWHALRSLGFTSFSVKPTSRNIIANWCM